MAILNSSKCPNTIQLDRLQSNRIDRDTDRDRSKRYKGEQFVSFSSIAIKLNVVLRLKNTGILRLYLCLVERDKKHY